MLSKTFPLITAYKGAEFGMMAGFIATWSISSFIAASEIELGLPPGTFYSIMGISLGMDNVVHAAYMGFALHMATGSILGAMFGAISIRWIRNIMPNPYKSALAGLATGVILWLALFLPVTVVLVYPSIQRVALLLASSSTGYPLLPSDTATVSQFFTGVSISAIAFHLLWGIMFGFIASSLFRIEVYKRRRSKTIRKSHKNHAINKRSISIACFGLASGLISSLAISGLLLTVEKSTSIPVGTFYAVLAATIFSAPYNTISAGFLVHLAAGSVAGLVLSMPYSIDTRNRISAIVNRYAPAYGIAFGICLWLLLFIPVTLALVIPFLNNIDPITITQQTPSGKVVSFSSSASELQAMTGRIIVGALAFNVFFGLLASIVLKSICDRWQHHQPGKLLAKNQKVD